MGSIPVARSARSLRFARMCWRLRSLEASISIWTAQRYTLADQLAHEPHAVALLLQRHQQRALERGRHRGAVVGIDDERLRELARGAGEARQDQHTLLVVARGNEFLGHEVHAVMQARDDTGVGGAEQLVDLVGRMMPSV
jgi:hypothetical protein